MRSPSAGLPMPSVSRVTVCPSRWYLRSVIFGISEDASSSWRTLATVLSLTAHSRAISAFDHCTHSGSRSSRSMALRLSSLVRRSPCCEFAPTEYRIASRAVPGCTSASMVSEPICLAAATRWKPSARMCRSPSRKTVTGGNFAPARISSPYSSMVCWSMATRGCVPASRTSSSSLIRELRLLNTCCSFRCLRRRPASAPSSGSARPVPCPVGPACRCLSGNSRSSLLAICHLVLDFHVASGQPRERPAERFVQPECQPLPRLLVHGGHRQRAILGADEAEMPEVPVVDLARVLADELVLCRPPERKGFRINLFL